MKKTWLIYDHERANTNSWLINHYLTRAPQHGIDLELVYVEDLTANFPAHSLPDAAIMRCINLEIHTQLETHGVRVYNSAQVSATTNNKATCYEHANAHGIPTLDYQVITHADQLTLPLPAVTKPLDGHGGKGVTLVHTTSELADQLQHHNPLIVQEIADTPGKDVRVYTLGGKIIAAVERQAQEGNLRANFTLGGKAKLIEATPEMREYVAISSATLLIDFAGIDFLYHNGSVVLGEIEDVVGARMLYELTDIDVVDEYLAYIASGARASE